MMQMNGIKSCVCIGVITLFFGCQSKTSNDHIPEVHYGKAADYCTTLPIRAVKPQWGLVAYSDHPDLFCSQALAGQFDDQTDFLWGNCHEIPYPCYAYATNVYGMSSWTYPGCKHKTISECHELLDEGISDCSQLISNCTADGLSYLGNTSNCDYSFSENEHLIAAYFGQGSAIAFHEFHFIRKDADGSYWSGKNGRDAPKQTDDNGSFITQPGDAVFKLADVDLKFCGCFKVNPLEICKNASDCLVGWSSPPNWWPPGTYRDQLQTPGCGQCPDTEHELAGCIDDPL